MEAVLFGIPFLIFIVIGGVALLGTVFWIWMLIDCAMNEPDQGNDKMVWVVIILFTHFLGGILYFLIRRPKRIERYGN